MQRCLSCYRTCPAASGGCPAASTAAEFSTGSSSGDVSQLPRGRTNGDAEYRRSTHVARRRRPLPVRVSSACLSSGATPAICGSVRHQIRVTVCTHSCPEKTPKKLLSSLRNRGHIEFSLYKNSFINRCLFTML